MCPAMQRVGQVHPAGVRENVSGHVLGSVLSNWLPLSSGSSANVLV